MHSLQKPAVASCLAVFCCLLWSSAYPGIKISYEWGQISDVASQILLAGFRFTLAGLLTLILALILRQPLLPISKKAFHASTLFGLLQTTLHYILFYIALSSLTGSLGSVLEAASALFTVLLAFLLPPHEKLRSTQIFGLVLGFFGIIVINLNGIRLGSAQLFGALLMLGSSFIQGLSNLILKKISPLGPPFQITALQLTFGGLVLLIIGGFLGGSMRLSWPFILLIIYLALVTSIAFSIWTMLLRYNPAGKIASFMFLIPIFGSILSAIFLGERFFSLLNLCALLFVSFGVYLVNAVREKAVKSVSFSGRKTKKTKRKEKQMATILAYTKKPGKDLVKTTLELNEKLDFGVEQAQSLIGSAIRQTVIKQDSGYQIDLFSAQEGTENFKRTNGEIIYGEAIFVKRRAINGEYEEIIAEDMNPEDLLVIEQNIAD